MDVMDLFELLLTAKNVPLISKMVNEDYATIVRRDGDIYNKMNAICETVLGQGVAPVNPMQAMMKQMFSGGKK